MKWLMSTRAEDTKTKLGWNSKLGKSAAEHDFRVAC